MKENKIFSNSIMVITALPITEILEVEILHRENMHGYAGLTAYVQSDSINQGIGGKIAFYKLEDGDQNLLFQGTVENIRVSTFGSCAKAEITAYTSTRDLEGETRSRSFQNVQLSYAAVAGHVIQNWGGNVVWEKGNNRQITMPVIQYHEDDWQFLVRLASHLHMALYPVLTEEHTVNIGWKKGKRRQGGRILEKGISDLYYTLRASSGIHDKMKFSYLLVEHNEEWQIGDYLLYNNFEYAVYRRTIKYKNGELKYYYELGRDGVLYHKKQYADNLKGARLIGTICKVIQESVIVQLDIDTEEKSAYEWPWTPEVGNICYLMPEAGTKAILYFPSAVESEGIVIHQLRRNGNLSRSADNKELVTEKGKMLKLYSKEISLESAKESLRLTDDSGIELNSAKRISMTAAGSIYITGKKINVTAPNRIVCQTDTSNIEMCRSFNFYAPGGVQKTEKIKDAVCQKPERKIEEYGGCYQAAFAALASIPTGNCAMDIEELEVSLMGSGAVPKIGNGATAFSMMETMKGKRKDEVSFPDALGSMDNYTNNGAYAIPKE